MNPLFFRPSATPVALLPASIATSDEIASSDGCALSIAISARNCCPGYPYAVAATYVRKQLGMHIRGLLLSCPWANEASYPNEIWDSLPEIHALSVACFPIVVCVH